MSFGKTPDWICLEHSQAGDGEWGCTDCAKKERDRREAAKDARILELEGTIDQLRERVDALLNRLQRL